MSRIKMLGRVRNRGLIDWNPIVTQVSFQNWCITGLDLILSNLNVVFLAPFKDIPICASSGYSAVFQENPKPNLYFVNVQRFGYPAGNDSFTVSNSGAVINS